MPGREHINPNERQPTEFTTRCAEHFAIARKPFARRPIALKSPSQTNDIPSTTPPPRAPVFPLAVARGWKNQATVPIDPITFHRKDVRRIPSVESAVRGAA